MKNNLTICIPTYNRKKSIIRLVSSIIEQNLLSIVNLIVIDDGSSDETFIELNKIEIPVGVNVRFIKQENRGLAATFLRFFSECETEYLLMMADDDKIIGDGIEQLIKFLTETKPDFASTIWLDTDSQTIFRGQTVATTLKTNEIRRAADHAPGLVYRVASFAEAIGNFEIELEKKSYAAYIFPQVVLVFFLSLYSDKLWWCPIKSGGFNVKGAETSGLRDKSGNHWSSVAGRWQEQKSFASIYLQLSEKSTSKAKKREYKQILENHNSETFIRLRSGIHTESPELVDLYDGGSVFYLMKNLPKKTKSFWAYLKNRYSF